MTSAPPTTLPAAPAIGKHRRGDHTAGRAWLPPAAPRDAQAKTLRLLAPSTRDLPERRQRPHTLSHLERGDDQARCHDPG
jgi:hypothetical protein